MIKNYNFFLNFIKNIIKKFDQQTNTYIKKFDFIR